MIRVEFVDCYYLIIIYCETECLVVQCVCVERVHVYSVCVRRYRQRALVYGELVSVVV